MKEGQQLHEKQCSQWTGKIREVEGMISVIIPVFRVEKYLDVCVQSVLAQTYEDLEILLIDDGSDDSCPVICDRYAASDARVKVFHKQNGGLSDARNTGLSVAVGEYILFVDSDDYIHPKLCETVVEIMERQERVDVLVFPFQKVGEFEDEAYKNVKIGEAFEHILSRKELISKMFQEEYESYIVAWNKCYRKSVWDTLRFPYGRIHEDQFTTYKALCEARQVAFLEQPMYYYRQRGGSIMSKFHAKGCMDDILALQEKIMYFSDKEPWEYGCCGSRSLEHMIYHYKRAKKNKADEEAKEIRDIFSREWRKLRRQKLPGITKERTAYFNSFLISEKWMDFYMNLYWKCLSLKRKLG